MNNIRLKQGDCLEVLKKAPADYADSLVTDPPAGIGFMGKSWDSDKGGRDAWIAWLTEVMAECMRVLKPGAHGLVWALPRTSHWTATALENAGFEIRDVVTHLFGTGFPKSLNLGNGYGTALKPASEHWILIRKPLSEKTVAANVLKHGTGGINIDGCRIGLDADVNLNARQRTTKLSNEKFFDAETREWEGQQTYNPTGRFPANLVLDEEAAAMLDEQSGTLKSGAFKQKGLSANTDQPGGWKTGQRNEKDFGPANEGGASRFFYVAKASKKDKGADNTHPTVKSTALMEYLIKLVTPEGGAVLDPFMGSGSTGVAAVAQGFGFVGIEKEAEYFEIASGRINLSKGDKDVA